MAVIQAPGELTQIAYLLVALGLSSVIGLEREYRQKSAGLRTNTIVGLGAALFMVISKYGFFDIVQPGVTLDPSRVAAQIVTGIGFIGAGIIFVRRNDVRGLTTAAGVWLTAAVGAACGAGMLTVAAVVTGAYMVVAFVYPRIIGLVRRASPLGRQLSIAYLDGRGVLRKALAAASERGFEIVELSIEHENRPLQAVGEGGGRTLGPAWPGQGRGGRVVTVTLEVEGKGPTDDLATAIAQIDGVLAVDLEDPREESR